MDLKIQLNDVVKYVIEFAYRQFKKEFIDEPNSKDLILRYKAVLLLSTDSLISKVEELFCKSKNLVDCVSSATPKSPNHIIPSSNYKTADLSFVVTATSSKENLIKGKFIDGEFNSYQFHVKSYSDKQKQYMNTTTIEKRFSDFKKLHLQIEKSFPALIVPPLPAIGVSRYDKTEFRKRNLTMWLEYLLNIPQLRDYPSLATYYPSETINQRDHIEENAEYDIDKIFSTILSSSRLRPRNSASNIAVKNSKILSKRYFEVISSQVRLLQPIGMEVMQKGDSMVGCMGSFRQVLSDERRFNAHPQKSEHLIPSSFWDVQAEICARHSKLETNINDSIIEPLSFFYGSGLKKAKDILQKNVNHETLKLEDFNSDPTYLKSWSSFRQIKSASILSKIISFVRETILLHQESNKILSDLYRRGDTLTQDTNSNWQNTSQSKEMLPNIENRLSYMSSILNRVTIPVGSRRNPVVHGSNMKSNTQTEVDVVKTESTERPSIVHDVHVKKRVHAHRNKKITTHVNHSLPKDFYETSSSFVAQTHENESGPTSSSHRDDELSFPPLQFDCDDTADLSQQIQVDPALLPSGWDVAVSSDGRLYYYHAVAKLSRWTPPTQEVAALVEQRLSMINESAELNAKKRMLDIEEFQSRQANKEIMLERLRGEIKRALHKWKNPPSLGRRRDIGELLSTLHTIVPTIQEHEITGSEGNLTCKSPSNSIKKAYLRAIRILHPDKFSATMTEEEKIMAEEVFICINEEYQNLQNDSH